MPIHYALVWYNHIHPFTKCLWLLWGPHWQSSVDVIETIWLVKPQIFTTWPFIKNYHQLPVLEQEN